MNNLEWLYEHDEAFAYGANKFVVDDGYSYCETIDQAHKWLLSEHETNGIGSETNGIVDGPPLVDEPPESDAIEHARWRWKYRPGTKSEVVMSEYNCDLLMSDLDAIADMVERDYVSREKWAEAIRAMKTAQDAMERARDERDDALEIRDKALGDAATFKAERDELKNRHCPHYHADKHYCDIHETRIKALIAERDEWKRKAEAQRDSNGTCPDGNGTHPDETATCNNSGGFVTDSREQLEADVRQYANPSGGTNNLGAYWEKKMLEFLDRQAAIIEREHPGLTISEDESLINWHGKNYLLQSRVLNAERERDEFSLKLKHEMELNRDNRNALDLERIAELQQQVDDLQRKLEAVTQANDDYRAEWHRVCAERLELSRKLGDCQAERDQLREKYSKAIDHALAICNDFDLI